MEEAYTQKTEYPLIEEHTLNYRGLHIMSKGIFPIEGFWVLWINP